MWACGAIMRRKTVCLSRAMCEAAFAVAEAVGDDTLQHRTQGYTVPHTYTHGTSAQRK